MGNGQSGAGKKVTTIRIIMKIKTPHRPSPNSQDCKASIHSRSGSRNQPRHSTSKRKPTATHGHQPPRSFSARPGRLAVMELELPIVTVWPKSELRELHVWCCLSH